MIEDTTKCDITDKKKAWQKVWHHTEHHNSIIYIEGAGGDCTNPKGTDRQPAEICGGGKQDDEHQRRFWFCVQEAAREESKRCEERERL